MKKTVLTTVSLCLFLLVPTVFGFDHSHQQWDRLLRKNVVLIRDGKSSSVRYAGFKSDRRILEEYGASLSAVDRREFDGWARDQRLAFLINAYNAFTVQLILRKYPDLKSIKDLSFFFRSPWKRELFELFGEEIHLDGIEHGLIRQTGVYDEPLIHMVLVCAAVSCPPLRNEAYLAEKLERQLLDNTARFLGDRKRNRFDPVSRTLRVSKIFSWYGGDFTNGNRGFTSLQVFFAPYVDRLTDNPADRSYIRNGKAEIQFLDYDWALNDYR